MVGRDWHAYHRHAKSRMVCATAVRQYARNIAHRPALKGHACQRIAGWTDTTGPEYTTMVAAPIPLFCYKQTHDTGFAPNPFHGHCPLTTCKAGMRRSKCVGDWIAGFTS